MIYPRDSDQLQLGLFPGEPWDGISPRVLTRGHLGLIFKPEGQARVKTFVDPLQYDFFDGDSAPLLRRVAPSAVTLLPLPYKGG